MSDDNNAILEVLARLESRLDRLENKVDALTGADQLEDAPTEMFDSSAPAEVAETASVETRLARFENALTMLETLSVRLPTIADALASVTVYAANEAAARNIDVLALGERSLDLATKAAQPDKLDLADKLLDASGDLALALDASKKLQAELATAGLGLPAVVDASAPAAAKLAVLATTPGFKKLLDSGLLDEGALTMAAKAGDALVQTEAAGADALGMWGLFRALGEPEVQKAAGFGVAFARRLGSTL